MHYIDAAWFTIYNLHYFLGNHLASKINFDSSSNVLRFGASFSI